VTWDESVKAEVQKRWRVGQTFSLNDVYRLEGHFSKLFPRNDHIPAKLRQVLQNLRDDGMIEFLDDRGNYRRIRYSP
jgi:type II restriction enzyme